MEWSEWINLSPPDLARRVRRRLGRSLGHNDFIALYNVLMRRAASDPRGVAAQAMAIVPVLRKQGRTRDALIFEELRARSCALAGDLEGTSQALEIIMLYETSDSRTVALDIARAVWADPGTFGSSVDQIPRALAVVTTVFEFYGEREALALAHLEAAGIYSRHNASQAAYRSIADAETIAHELESSSLLANVYKVAASTACEEGDFKWSVGAAERCLAVHRQTGSQPPPDLLSNLGVARMNLSQYSAAAHAFEEALKQFAPGTTERAAVHANLAACFRKADDLLGARAQLDLARAERGSEPSPETDLEIELVSARVSASDEDPASIGTHLSAASEHLDAMLAGVLRLHHRRGLRERYVPRIEAMMRPMPDEGSALDVLKALTTVRSNALGDWLGMLDWAQQVSCSSHVREKDKADLAAGMQKVRNFGAPHLFGFREKYDDAWQPWNSGSGWDDLSSVVAALTARGVQPPWPRTGLARLWAACEARLGEGHCLMAVTYAGEDPLLWSLIGDRYRKVPLPGPTLVSWEVARYRHALGEISRATFAAETRTMVNRLSRDIGFLLDAVADARCRSIRLFQDFADSFPITAVVLQHPRLAQAMAEGTFEVRIVEALHPSKEYGPLATPSVLAITDRNDDLLLARHEGAALAAAARASAFRVLDAGEDGDLPNLLRCVDVLLVSTHSSRLDFYTDPYFARMGTGGAGHLVGVEALQQSAPDLDLSAVVLNACHSGSGSARNFQKSFRTADAVSFPALFVLNGQAIVSATGWRTSDTVGYLHAYLVGEAR
jgi:tetratricopeptide (TPR) repeat protein